MDNSTEPSREMAKGSSYIIGSLEQMTGNKVFNVLFYTCSVILINRNSRIEKYSENKIIISKLLYKSEQGEVQEL